MARQSDTSLFVRGEKALRRFDPILCDTLDTEMKKQGMTVVPGATPKAVVKESDGTLTLQLEDGTSHGEKRGAGEERRIGPVCFQAEV